ncbi:MAG: MBOAT family protein [Mogibacterium sp.]|nr:MBOAT family protein [Mogibacterium sp.]MBQ6501526.1 MBOAT family protein [Mogibacterium sp.]
MALTSLPFAAFAIITGIVYFAVPKKQYQWVVLLIASSFFYVYNSFQYTVFILVTIITIYLAATKMADISKYTKAEVKNHKAEWSKEEKKAFKDASQKKRRRVLAACLILNFGILFLLKYFNFFSGSIASLLGGSPDEAPQIHLLLPLGVSFYTFIATGYLIDVYRETVEPERNIFKFALFVSFFPQIIQGPISSYNKLHSQLIGEHKLEWINFKQGVMNIFWGLFKKLVIADCAWRGIKAYYANGGLNGTADFEGYGGTMVLFISLLYALQLYTDFSGGIDISRGICRIMGIELEVNFRQPYFSKSISEYWRRWHITLGAWMKNYVFYPIAMSDLSKRISAAIAGSSFGKTAAGKHLSKVFTTAMASFIVFLCVGIWHGANSKYIGFGVWNGLIIMLSAMLGPVYDKSRNALHINSEAAWWKLFQMLRTFVIVLIGYIFDIADNFTNAIQMMKLIISDQNKSVFMEQIKTLGLYKTEYATIMLGAMILLYISIRLEITSLDTPGELLERRSGFIQWLALLGLIMLVLVLGTYGPLYDPAEFVYMQF